MNKQRTLRFQIIFPIAMAMLVIVLLVSFTTPSFVKRIIQSQVSHNSINALQQIKTLRAYYTQHIVKKVQDNTDMLVAIEHYNKSDTIPLPATMIHDLSELFDKNGSQLRLYSHYPFPQREQRHLDKFEEKAWFALNQQPEKVIETLEIQGDKSFLRVAIADQMQVQTCVDCHNNHPLTPKADWQLGDVRGVLEISTDITKQMALAEQISSAIVIFIMFAYVLLMVIFFFVTRRITKHVSYISKAMVELGDGNVDAQVDLASSTLEIGQMAKAFTTFKQALLKTQALEKRQQLMESEKIDGLGRMLASVAHDVNTPISIGITAASLMSDKIARIEEQIAKGELTKSDMEKFIASATESMQVVSSNLVSAGNLIKSFKQVSVDQISEEQRQIVLSEYIKEIVHSLKPRLTRAKATVLVDCQQDCQFYTYPGLLSQVVSNLITNSLIHGFGQQPGGKIIITLNGNAEGNINIHYQDDGIGIPVEHQDKVMEPFFTTKREQGGSGLGLSIVHTIVTQKLAGTIKLVSNQEQGVIFDICFPAKCPSKEAER